MASMVSEMGTIEKLSTVLEAVRQGMERNPCLRLHKNGDWLVEYVSRRLGRCVSSESVLRCQRLVWGEALAALKRGVVDGVKRYLPDDEQDLIDWFSVRKDYYEAYRLFFMRRTSAY